MFQRVAGCPGRFAHEALGHNRKAVHRAYAKRTLMKIPSLEDYEHRAAAKETAAYIYGLKIHSSAACGTKYPRD